MERLTNERESITSENYQNFLGKNRFPKSNGVVIKSPRGKVPETLEVNGRVYIRTNTKSLNKRQAEYEEETFENDHLGKKLKKVIKKAGRVAKTTISPAMIAAKAFKKSGSSRKKLLKRAVGGLKKAGRGIGKVAKKVGKAASLAPLVPLMPVMGLALRKKGFTPPKKVGDRAELFYNKIVRGGHSNYEQHFNGYSEHDDHLAPAIVVAVINFVKTAINKRKARKAGDTTVDLSPVEEAVADSGEKTIKEIETKAVQSGVSKNEILDVDLPPSSNERESPDEPTTKTKKIRGGKNGGLYAGQEAPEIRQEAGFGISGKWIAPVGFGLIAIYMLTKK